MNKLAQLKLVTAAICRTKKMFASFDRQTLLLDDPSDSDSARRLSVSLRRSVPSMPLSVLPSDPSLRPVILVGPLQEAVVDKLEQDFPHMFQRCLGQPVRGSLQALERGLQDLSLLDFRRRGSHFECLTLQAVRSIAHKVRESWGHLACGHSCKFRLNF